MNRLTKKQVLEQTNGGLGLFQILLPDLEMCEGRNRTNIDSPISKGRKCLSIFKRSSQLYYFKDHSTGHFGDIFEFIACLNKLDSKNDFKRILEIIDDIMDGCYCQIPNNQTEEYYDAVNETTLELVKEGYSEMYIEKYFKKDLPYLESLPRYPLHLVRSFNVVDSMGKRVRYEFDYSRPQDAFYALRIRRGEFYLLFNARSRKCYQWGNPGEFYIVGMENLFTIAYSDNVYLRGTIVLTNSIEGLLFLQDKGIPCIALLNGETGVSEYFDRVISPLFPNKYLLLDLLPKRDEQMKVFTEDYGCQYIRSKETYLGLFFKKHTDAVDHIMSHFEFKDDFQYEGYASNIVRM